MRVLVPFLVLGFLAAVYCKGPLKVCYDGRPPKKVKCESWKYKFAKCPVKGGDIIDVDLLKQESRTKCKKGVNWDFKQDYITVDKGCRAIFHVCFKAVCDNGKSSKDVKCESWKYKYAKCPVKGGVIKDVYLYKQESITNCKKGGTWDFKRDFISVDKGCRARFHVCFKGVPKVHIISYCPSLQDRRATFMYLISTDFGQNVSEFLLTLSSVEFVEAIFGLNSELIYMLGENTSHFCYRNVWSIRGEPCRRPGIKVAWTYDKTSKKCRRIIGCYKYSYKNVFRNRKNCEKKCLL